MGTWLDDMKRDNPALAADYTLVGNQDESSLRNMIRALSSPISAFMNTPEDEKRLAAAKRILAARRKLKKTTRNTREKKKPRYEKPC